MKNNMHYISLYFFKRINLLLNERIETLNYLMESIKNDKDYNTKKHKNIENMGILMNASIYITKISSRNLENKEEKNEIIASLNDILTKISKVKNQIIMIDECMKLSDDVLFAIIYCYIIKDKNKILKNFYNKNGYFNISEKEKKDNIYKAFNLKDKNYNYKKISSIFIEYIDKYNIIFDFFNENKETIRILLEEKIGVSVLSSYMICTQQNFKDFRKIIENENIKDISYKDVFINIVEKTTLFK